MKSEDQNIEAKGYDYDYADAEATRTRSLEGEVDIALPGAVGETHRGLKSRHIQFLYVHLASSHPIVTDLFPEL